MRRAALGLVAGLLAGCWLTTTATDGGSTATPAEPMAATSELAGQVGQVLELTVPLWGGGRIELAELCGRPVLLAFEDASVAEREATHDRYRALVDAHEEIAVVVVALDPREDDLPAGWHEAPPFVLGWDPQGALAARLGLVTLPTVVLLDGGGTVVSVHEGTAPDGPTLDAWLAPGNGTKAACVAAAP